MKTILLAVTGLCLTLTSLCQVQFNVFAGPQTTTAAYSANDVEQETTSKYGFQLGMGMKVPIEGSLYFAPAIYYSMKGYEVTFTQFVFPPDVEALDNNTSFHTLETAFLLQYDFSKKASHFYINIGPSLDFQLSGKEKYNTATKQVDQSIPFAFDKYGHYAASGIFRLGYEMSNGFFLFAQYTHGLASISNADDGPSIRHRVAGISIGKSFKCKK